MTDENIGEAGKKTLSRDAVIAILVVAGVVIGLAAFLVPAMLGMDDEHAKYATGETYEVTGRIVKADSHHAKGARGTALYCDIEIETDQELPDGTHTYASKDGGDFRKLGSYAEHLGEELAISISEEGTIREVRKAGSPRQSEIGHHSDSGNENVGGNTGSK